MNKMIEWTEEKLQYLREHFPTETSHDIADVIGCSDSTVRVKAKELGLEKDPSFNRQNFRYRYAQRSGVISGKTNGDIKK